MANVTLENFTLPLEQESSIDKGSQEDHRFGHFYMC